MQKEAAQELIGRYCHQFLFAAVSVILPAKCHKAIGEVNDSMIGDGDAMGVAGQVMKSMLRAAERRFGIHDPILTEKRTKEGAECRFLRKRLKTAWKS